MTDLNTFGFEAEFQTNVDALISGLSARGLADQSSMHGYHCHCEEVCDFETGATLRAQTDSSCGGEVITTIFNNHEMDGAIAAMQAIQEVAVEVDAEPSLQAGFHVHVGKPHTNNQQFDALLAYLCYEGILTHLATGRFEHIRGFNFPLRRSMSSVDLYPAFQDAGLDVNLVSQVSGWGDFHPERLLAITDTVAARRAVTRPFYDYARILDRHGYLSVNTASGATWEYRLWNSTRSAWRMEMFVRLSLLMADRDAVSLLLANEEPSFDHLLTVADRVDPDLAPLMQRQHDLAERSNGPFTVLLAS